MGEDKASLMVGGVALGERVASQLQTCCDKVTVIGRDAITGFFFIEDSEEYAGPLVALASFSPSADLVIVASCDLPLFEASIVHQLLERLGSHDAAVPEVEGRLQPLCALYRSSSFGFARSLASQGERRVMTWVNKLDMVVVSDLTAQDAARSVNTKEELARLLGH